jgi:hypothetical protein
MRTLNFRLLAAVLGSLALSLSLILPASATGAVRTSNHVAGQAGAITVQGTVTTGGGQPEAKAKVVIRAWPDQNVLQALKVGQTVPVVSVGSGLTNSSGKYSVSLPVAKLGPEATEGVVNLEADTSGASYAFSVVVTRNGGNAYLATSDPVINLSASSDRGGCPLQGTEGSYRYYKSLGKHWATVGQTYVPTSHATQQFSYLSGQFSTIEVGESGAGADGPFSADGSENWSNSRAGSTKGSWPTYGAYQSYWYRTEFHWGEYRCYLLGEPQKTYIQRVNGYFGGAHEEKPGSVPATKAKYCAPYTKGFTFVSNNSAAITWRKSFGIHAGFGFDASVVTGYDHDAQITYVLKRARWICGTEGPPGQAPRQLVVHFSDQ